MNVIMFDTKSSSRSCDMRRESDMADVNGVTNHLTKATLIRK